MAPGVLLDDTSSRSNGSCAKHVDRPKEPPYKTHIVEQPVTEQRPLYVPREGDRLIDPGTARVAQQHVEYFDQDHDGVIWPQDTYHGFRGWGWSIPLAFLIAAIIHVVMSYPTAPGILPDPFLRLYVDRVYKIQHGSDTMTFDMEGRYVPQNFENIFTKYDKENKGGLTWADVLEMCKGQRMVFDFFGWNATKFEWTMTYLLLWPEDGIMKKEDIRCCMDGSIFYKKAEENTRKQQARAKRQSATSAGLIAKAKKLL